MFEVIRYTDWGFTTRVLFASFSLAAAVKAMAHLGTGEEWEEGYYIIDDDGNMYNEKGECTRKGRP